MGSVLNHGIEGMFTWSDRINDWSYSVGANFVWSKNKVLKWNQVKHGEEYRYTVGRSTDAMMGLVAEGLFGKDVAINGHAPQTFADYQEGDIAYKDLNGDGKLDDGDELLGELEEADKGIYEMKELLYGKYLVKETKAPEGFVLDEGVYSVFIEENGKTYQVENEAGVGFINDAMRGSLKIVKTSSDGKVEGFSFRVTGENGYDKTFVTDAKGEILIENLRIGEYTISEVSDKASANYVLPANKDATVKVGSTTVVTMHNELRDTPKTGDNSHLGLWFTLAGLSALGIAATTFVALKKKKKEDAE